MNAALTGGSIVIYGDGRQSRDFVYLSDVVVALISAATAERVDRRVLNIGSGEETDVNLLNELIAEAVGRPVRQVWNREKSAGVPRLVADIREARKLLGFRPAVTLAEGLRRLLDEDSRFAQGTLAPAGGNAT